MAAIARYLNTPVPQVLEMEGDLILSCHSAAIRLLEAEQPKR